jgi:hypothetical protein
MGEVIGDGFGRGTCLALSTLSSKESQLQYLQTSRKKNKEGLSIHLRKNQLNTYPTNSKIP